MRSECPLERSGRSRSLAPAEHRLALPRAEVEQIALPASPIPHQRAGAECDQNGLFVEQHEVALAGLDAPHAAARQPRCARAPPWR